MMIITFAVLGAVILFNLMLILFWHFGYKYYNPALHEGLTASVLIAARNEEKNISGCLKALLAQHYPSGKVEILVGDDMSEDRTAEIVRSFKEVRLISIKQNLGLARGKANVLAHLARQAKGDVFLITDADVQPGSGWISGMVSYLSASVGIVNGTTGIKNNILQHYEWLYAQGMIKVITDVVRPITAVGNNMLITREAYESTGGYENIEFSITEDYALFKAIEKNGYTLRQVTEPEVLAWSVSPGSLKNLLHQRKRWMRGAIQLPLWIVVVLALQGIYFPVLIIGFYLNYHWAVIIFLVKLFLQTVFIKSISDKLAIKLKGGLLLYELYSGMISTLSILFYLIPVKIRWKERRYK